MDEGTVSAFSRPGRRGSLLTWTTMSIMGLFNPHPTAGPPSGAGRYAETYAGTATARGPHVPDVATVLRPPEGRVFELTGARITVHAAVPAGWRQHAFFFSRFVRVTEGDETLFNPNLDFLATAPIKPGETGLFVGAGGTGSSPHSTGSWTAWAQPLRLNSGLEVIFGSDLAVGNSADLELAWTDAGPGVSVVRFLRHRGDGERRLFSVGPPPPGKRWYLHNAYLRCVVADAPGDRTAVAARRSDRGVLCEVVHFAPGDRLQSTGGYSTYQTGPALNPAASRTVYSTPQWVGPGDCVDVTFRGIRGDKFLYALSFTELPE